MRLGQVSNYLNHLHLTIKTILQMILRSITDTALKNDKNVLKALNLIAKLTPTDSLQVKNDLFKAYVKKHGVEYNNQESIILLIDYFESQSLNEWSGL